MKSKLTQIQFLDPENFGVPGQKLMNLFITNHSMKAERAYGKTEEILRSDQPKQKLEEFLSNANYTQQDSQELVVEILEDGN